MLFDVCGTFKEFVTGFSEFFASSKFPPAAKEVMSLESTFGGFTNFVSKDLDSALLLHIPSYVCLISVGE